MQGTIRALTNKHFEHLRRRVEQVVALTAEAHGCTAVTEWSARPYIPTVNSQAGFEMVRALRFCTL